MKLRVYFAKDQSGSGLTGIDLDLGGSTPSDLDPTAEDGSWRLGSARCRASGWLARLRLGSAIRQKQLERAVLVTGGEQRWRRLTGEG
jgi:hypothetical protein